MSDLVQFPARQTIAQREPYLRQAGAAEHANVSARTIGRWHVLGLPVHRVGNVCLYRASDIDAFIERGSS